MFQKQAKSTRMTTSAILKYASDGHFTIPWSDTTNTGRSCDSNNMVAVEQPLSQYVVFNAYAINTINYAPNLRSRAVVPTAQGYDAVPEYPIVSENKDWLK